MARKAGQSPPLADCQFHIYGRGAIRSHPYEIRSFRGCGAAGSAPAWHAGGQGFKSPQLHQKLLIKTIGSIVCVSSRLDHQDVLTVDHGGVRTIAIRLARRHIRWEGGAFFWPNEGRLLNWKTLLFIAVILSIKTNNNIRVSIMSPKQIKKETLFTIGHSTRTIDEFIALLKAHEIQGIVDVRTIPKSRHNPQFNGDTLECSLQEAGIDYVHRAELGGLRHTTSDSKNLGWNNHSFRGFADYMATPEFAEGIDFLEEFAKKEKTAIMCAEAVPWRCHRSLIADAISKRGWNVFDIMTLKTVTKHRMTPFLKVRKGKLTYPIPKP
jgi:hypothetical protein